MKILVYPATMEIGGSTLNALELAARVQARGHDVIVYGNDDALADVASSLGLEVLPACDRDGWPSLADVARLRGVVKRRRIQIVHGYEGGPALDLAYLSSITSRVVPMTTIMSMVVPFELPRHSDMFVGTPEMQAEAASTRARVRLMEPPIDTDLNRAKDPVGARSRMGIVDGMTCLSIVCRLTQDLGKLPGVLEAVQVTDSLAWDHPLQLLVAGGGTGLSDLHAAADEVNTRHGRPVVLVAGPMIDPRDAYDATDIALGMGSSALKAMSFSKPLVVQGDHGFWRLFNHVTASDFAHSGMFGDGGNGAADLHPILEGLLAARSSWEELGRLGRATVETRYSLDAATDVLIAAYEEALLRPHGRWVVWRETAYTSKELAKYHVAKWDERRCGGRIRSTVHRPRAAGVVPVSRGEAVGASQQCVPTVSVVIPVYNYGRFLADCVNSALTQTGVDVDVVVVDDCSTDDTRDVARRLIEKDPRVRLVVAERNGGHIANFNRSLEQASGEFVVKLDADDALPAGSLARSAALLSHHPDVSFVYGRPLVFNGDEPPLIDSTPQGRAPSWTVWRGAEWVENRLRHGHNPIMQPEVMIRRSALQAVGGHRPELPASSDLNLWLRLASVGDVGHVNGPVQGLYRIHDSNMHNTMHGGLLADLEARWSAFASYVDEASPAGPDDRARATVIATFRRDAIRLAEQMCDGPDPDVVEVEAVLAFAGAFGLTRRQLWRARALRTRVSLIRSGHGRAARTVPGRLRRELDVRLRWRMWNRSGQ